MPYDARISDKLLQKKVEIEAKPYNPTFLGIPTWIISLIMPIGFMFYILRGFTKQIIGKQVGKKFDPQDHNITFKDVAGIDEAKEELTEIVDFLKKPADYEKLGAKIPKGVLLYGPPGTGKTLLAKAIAGEAGVPFFYAAGSDFVEMYVGLGAKRVRALFEEAKKVTPCIIFVDEIDVLGSNREKSSSHSEQEQTLNSLLAEMNGFSGNSGIIVIGATNRMDAMDAALLRPGRFDRRIAVTNPDLKGRKDILAVHTAKLPLAKDVDIETVARGTPGFSGADLANLCNEAALIAARTKKTKINMVDFEAAKDKIVMGLERRSLTMSEEEKKLTAYHEAGHAIVTLHVDEADPLHKVTIVPRGMALGVTMSLPLEDRLSQTITGLESRLAIAYGGREAERLVFGAGKITTGASSDIRAATDIAWHMVAEYGMSDMGSIRLSSTDSALMPLIYDEQRKIVTGGETRAREILTKHEDELHALAQALLKHETMMGAEIDDLLATLPSRTAQNAHTSDSLSTLRA